MMLRAFMISLSLMLPAGGAYAWEWFSGQVNNGSSTSEVSGGEVEHYDHSKAPDPIACIKEILEAQKRYNIPDNILLAIGMQESGISRDGHGKVVWPYAANSHGKGYWFDNKEQAANWVRKRIKSGVRSVDVGCMQINLRWHPDAFATIEDGFDPQKNVDYAARLLVSRYRTMGSWIMGAGAYHSFTPDTRDKYIKHLRPKIAQVNRDVEVYRDKVASYQVVETSSTKVPAARRNASKNGSFKWLSPNSGKPSSLWSQE